MHTPVEKKFNEYVGAIHTRLHDDASYLDVPFFINQLLDRIELLKRNFILLSSEKEDVFTYQEYLGRLSKHAGDTLEWVEKHSHSFEITPPTMRELKHNLFLLSDLFTTSKNLINSFYPVE